MLAKPRIEGWGVDPGPDRRRAWIEGVNPCRSFRGSRQAPPCINLTSRPGESKCWSAGSEGDYLHHPVPVLAAGRLWQFPDAHSLEDVVPIGQLSVLERGLIHGGRLIRLSDVQAGCAAHAGFTKWCKVGNQARRKLELTACRVCKEAGAKARYGHSGMEVTKWHVDLR